MRNALLFILVDFIRYDGQAGIELERITVDDLAIVAEGDINRKL